MTHSFPPAPDYGSVPQYPIESVDNALKVLLLLGEEPKLRLTDVSRYLGVASSTAHRLLAMLQYRGFVRQDAATRLVSARTEEEAALLERLRLEAVRDEGMLRATAPAGEQPKIGQLQNLRFLVERLNDEIEVAQQEVEAAAEGVRERLEEYSSAFRERHMIDKLREKALETHRSEEVQADRKAMDSVALSRFIRARAVRRAQES